MACMDHRPWCPDRSVMRSVRVCIGAFVHIVTQNTLFGATLFLQMVLESVLLVLAPSI
jgi:hypothetical protein